MMTTTGRFLKIVVVVVDVVVQVSANVAQHSQSCGRMCIMNHNERARALSLSIALLLSVHLFLFLSTLRKQQFSCERNLRCSCC